MMDFAVVASKVRAGELSIAKEASAMVAFVQGLDDVPSLRECQAQADAVAAYLQTCTGETAEYNAAVLIQAKVKHRLGEVLAATVRRGGDRKGGSKCQADTLIPDALGATADQRKNTSARAQRLATVPFEAIEAKIKEATERGEKVKLGRVVKAIERERKRAEAEAAGQGEQSETAADLKALLAAGQKFGCIYADPPWRYENQGTRGSTDDHYVTMTVEQIAAMPVAELAAESAHLHIWTTNAFLFDTLAVIRGWGFEYKSAFVWVKPQIGMGNYWRVSHEYLLLGVRGSCPFLANNLPSWGEFPRGRHSAKPEEVRVLVERASPGPYLELFGRRAVCGWTVFGNEVERDLFTQDEKESVNG